MSEDTNDTPVANKEEEALPKAPEVKENEATEPETPEPVKTPPNELFAALQEERMERKKAQEKIQELEHQMNALKTPETPEPEHSEEGLKLKREIERLESVVLGLQSKTELKDILTKHPALNDYLVEFDEYKEEYPGLPLDKVAMVFLAEKGALTEKKVVRPGLEAPSGGGQQAPEPGMSVEDLKRLRTENPKKYIKMIREGKIKVGHLKDR